MTAYRIVSETLDLRGAEPPVADLANLSQKYGASGGFTGSIVILSVTALPNDAEKAERYGRALRNIASGVDRPEFGNAISVVREAIRWAGL